MRTEDEAKLLQHLANIATALAVHNINAATQTDQILTHLSGINARLSNIDTKLALWEMKK